MCIRDRATGSTPLTTWRALAGRGLDLSRVRGFALDEYVGLSAGHPESYRSVITREVVEPLGLTPELVRVPGDDGPEHRVGGQGDEVVEPDERGRLAELLGEPVLLHLSLIHI